MLTVAYPDPTDGGAVMASAYIWAADLRIDGVTGGIEGTLYVHPSAAAADAGSPPRARVPFRTGEVVPSAIAPAHGFVCPSLADVLGSAASVPLAANPAPAQLWAAVLALVYQALSPAFPGAAVSS